MADKGVEVCIDNSFALFVKSLVHPAKVRDIPFFRRSEATVDKGLLHVQNTSDPQFKGKSLQNSFHHSGADPLREPAMTGLVRRITVGNVGPGSAYAQHSQNSVQNAASILLGSSACIRARCRFRNKVVQDFPLCVGEVSPVCNQHRICS